jgi:hypothetical protein
MRCLCAFLNHFVRFIDNTRLRQGLLRNDGRRVDALNNEKVRLSRMMENFIDGYDQNQKLLQIIL